MVPLTARPFLPRDCRIFQQSRCTRQRSARAANQGVSYLLKVNFNNNIALIEQRVLFHVTTLFMYIRYLTYKNDHIQKVTFQRP